MAGEFVSIPALWRLAAEAPQLSSGALGGLCSRIMRGNVQDFGESQWAADIRAIFEAFGPPPHCPHCSRSGFYGPRQAGERHYWLCKLCGYYRQTGAAPVACRPTAHRCPNWPSVAGSPYIWWVLPGEETYVCPYCSAETHVAETLTSSPSDEEDHPWHSVPEHGSFDEAAAWWTRHGQGRIYL